MSRIGITPQDTQPWHLCKPAAGFKSGILYTVLNRDETTAQVLPDIPTAAAYLQRHGVHLSVRAEHLNGLLVWRAQAEKHGHRWTTDRLINAMRSNLDIAEKVGYGRNNPDAIDRINKQQRLRFA